MCGLYFNKSWENLTYVPLYISMLLMFSAKETHKNCKKINIMDKTIYNSLEIQIRLEKVFVGLSNDLFCLSVTIWKPKERNSRGISVPERKLIQPSEPHAAKETPLEFCHATDIILRLPLCIFLGEKRVISPPLTKNWIKNLNDSAYVFWRMVSKLFASV